MAKSKYKDSLVIDVYVLAKSGMTENQIAQAIGISFDTLVKWEKKRKAFKEALDRGRKECRGKKKGSVSFKDYVFGRLSYKNRRLWNKINRIEKNKNKRKDIEEQIEILLEKRGKYARQSIFMYAWVSTNFSISAALRILNISILQNINQ